MVKRDTLPYTTLSARFYEQELALLRQATEIKQWSLSQLIRAGAFEKAVNIVNANSAAAHAVRRLLGEVLAQLFDAKVMESLAGRPESVDLFDPGRYGISPESNVYATKADLEIVVRFVKAIRSLGAELAPMFTEELRRVSFEPEVEFDLIDPTLVTAELPTEPLKAAPRPDGGKSRRTSNVARKPTKNRVGRQKN